MVVAPNSSILVVCAEASSTNYGVSIIKKIKEQGDYNIFGIGSETMQNLGMQRFGKSEDMAIMGLVEVIRHYKKIKSVFDAILAEVDRQGTKVALLVDYPGFNLRLAKKLKQRGVKVVYFISPSVWAWRKSRLKTIKDCVAEMLVIYPFEKDFYDKENVQASYVGNPLMETWSEDLVSEEAKALKKVRMGLSAADEVMALMPGSRKAEVEHHLAIQIATYKALKKIKPNLKANLLLAESIEREDVAQYITNDLEDFSIIKDEPFQMLQSVDHVLVASGTATLVVGLMQKPMLIMYKVNPITAWIARKLVSVKWVGIINLMFAKEVVPERIQEMVRVEELTRTYLDILKEENKSEMLTYLKALPNMLGKHETSKLVANRVLSYV